jgi:hypothetical protein
MTRGDMAGRTSSWCRLFIHEQSPGQRWAPQPSSSFRRVRPGMPRFGGPTEPSSECEDRPRKRLERVCSRGPGRQPTKRQRGGLQWPPRRSLRSDAAPFESDCESAPGTSPSVSRRTALPGRFKKWARGPWSRARHPRKVVRRRESAFTACR